MSTAEATSLLDWRSEWKPLAANQAGSRKPTKYAVCSALPDTSVNHARASGDHRCARRLRGGVGVYKTLRGVFNIV